MMPPTLTDNAHLLKPQVPRQFYRHRRSLILFLGMCLNLILAPAIYAGNEGSFSQAQAYAIGLLILTTFALSIYLFVVIFVPEKF